MKSISDPEGQVIGTSSEESRLQEQARIRFLLEQLPVVLWTVDENLVVTSAVGHGLIALNLASDQLVGTSVFDHLGTIDPAHPKIAALRRALQGEPSSVEIEQDGLFHRSVFQPMKDASGAINGVVAVTLNITDRKLLEARLQQAEKMEAVGQLAGGVAHDFNNILNVILGYAEMLAMEKDHPAPWHDDVEEIRKAAQRAAALTNQLLTFSRRQTLQPRAVNLNQELEDLRKMLERLVGENIRWNLSLTPDVWPVLVDPVRLQQAVINLSVNARDAMPDGGTISVSTANVAADGAHRESVPAGDYVCLSIRDTGSGISAETKAHLFEPFFTTKPEGKGTGLGLSLVFGMVKQSKGFIFVESDPGKGAAFLIYLPRAQG